VGLAVALALRAWTAARDDVQRAQWSLLLAYCALLVGPASQVYTLVDTWQDLASIARAIERDAAGKPLILFAPDETTRAIIDTYARTTVDLIPGPIDAASIDHLRADAGAAPQSLIVVLLPARAGSIAQRLRNGFGPRRGPSAQRSDGQPELPWLQSAGLRMAKSYALPNGRRYALLELNPQSGRLVGK
jgi:hypothetical protein